MGLRRDPHGTCTAAGHHCEAEHLAAPCRGALPVDPRGEWGKRRGSAASGHSRPTPARGASAVRAVVGRARRPNLIARLGTWFRSVASPNLIGKKLVVSCHEHGTT